MDSFLTKTQEFQSTLPVRGATAELRPGDLLFRISIHAPRAGSDESGRSPSRRLVISIHAPRAGSDEGLEVHHIVKLKISIHAPRAGSDHRKGRTCIQIGISIHAPRAGSD